MQVLVNFPKSEEGTRLFLNHLAILKVNLLLESIENLHIKEKMKDKVLDKVLETLNEQSKDSVI